MAAWRRRLVLHEGQPRCRVKAGLHRAHRRHHLAADERLALTGTSLRLGKSRRLPELGAAVVATADARARAEVHKRFEGALSKA